MLQAGSNIFPQKWEDVINVIQNVIIKIKRILLFVILNLFQDLSKTQATQQLGKMLKQVQHDILIDNLPQNHPNRSTQKRQKGHKYIVSTKVRKGGKHSNVKRVTS